MKATRPGTDALVSGRSRRVCRSVRSAASELEGDARGDRDVVARLALGQLAAQPLEGGDVVAGLEAERPARPARADVGAGADVAGEVGLGAADVAVVVRAAAGAERAERAHRPRPG